MTHAQIDGVTLGECTRLEDGRDHYEVQFPMEEAPLVIFVDDNSGVWQYSADDSPCRQQPLNRAEELIAGRPPEKHNSREEVLGAIKVYLRAVCLTEPTPGKRHLVDFGNGRPRPSSEVY